MDKREALRAAKDYADFHSHSSAGWFDNFEAALRERGIWLAPWEPTEAMLNALFVLPDTDGHGNIIRHTIDKLQGAYRAMRDAALNEKGR